MPVAHERKIGLLGGAFAQGRTYHPVCETFEGLPGKTTKNIRDGKG